MKRHVTAADRLKRPVQQDGLAGQHRPSRGFGIGRGLRIAANQLVEAIEGGDGVQDAARHSDRQRAELGRLTARR
jgi:hypothetical protein